MADWVFDRGSNEKHILNSLSVGTNTNAWMSLGMKKQANKFESYPKHSWKIMHKELVITRRLAIDKASASAQ